MQPAGGLWASSGEQNHGITYRKLEEEPELPDAIPVYKDLVFKK